MAYFDSPKNRAMWGRRLDALREEKERRKTEGYVPEQMTETVEVSDNPFRKKITFAQLEEEERLFREANRVRRPVREARRELDGAKRERTGPEKNGLEKSGPQKGMAR